MIKTIKLYDDKPYDREFTAKIIDIADAGEGFLDIVLATMDISVILRSPMCR